MAGYNEILTGRFNRALQKLLSMKGPASMNELSSTLQPQVTFGWGNEMRYLEGWNRFGLALAVGPAVGAVNAVQLFNPVASGVVAVIEKFCLQGAADIAVNGRHGVNGPGTNLATVFTSVDQRWDARTATQGSSSVFSSQTGAPAVIGVPKLSAPAGAGNSHPWDDVVSDAIQEMTILPGDAWQVIGATVNIAWFVSCWWRERPLEDSEKR